MQDFTSADLFAIALFGLAWLGYHITVELTPASRRSLNALMNVQREAWMVEMMHREARMIDTTLMASLQNGTAFFASTSLIAIGGSLALLQSTDAVLQVMADLPFGRPASRAAWEMKVVGLAVIFVYAFFKFAWSYRIFNYAAILVGATPMPSRQNPDAYGAAMRAAAMTVSAGRHFNRGQRAFFFALAYLGWFIGPYVLMMATLAVLCSMAWRQFASDAALAVGRPLRSPETTSHD